MLLATALLSACFAASISARSLRVDEMLDLEPATCSNVDLTRQFKQTVELYQDCHETFLALEAGMADVAANARNIATNAWWAWNVKEISHSTTRYDKGDLKTLRAAHRNLAKGVDFLTVERTGKPGRTRTMCSDSGFRKALYGFQVNPEAPMVLTIAGYYGGRSKAAWVPRDRRRWPILSTPLESVDVCEGEHLRILEPRGKKDAQLVICDSFYATADLDDSRPPAQLTEPASGDDLSRKRYAAARLIYATMHLRNPKKYSDPVMYYASDKKRTRLSINDPTAIAVMNKVPQYMTIVSPKDSPPDPVLMPSIYEAFCLASFWPREDWRVPPRLSKASKYFAGLPAGPEDSAPGLVSDDSEDSESDVPEGSPESDGDSIGVWSHDEDEFDGFGDDPLRR